MGKKWMNCTMMIVSWSVLLMLVRLGSSCAPSAWVLPERCPKSQQILLPSGKVYWAESRAATYEKAQATCRLKGGMIAVPTDKFENSALVWLKNCVDRFRPFWLGLRREEDNQTAAHRWVHAFGAVPIGSNIMITWPGGRPFSAWAVGEPNVAKDRRCVRIVSGSQNGSRRDKWADASCSSRHRYVCEKFTDPECSQYQVLMEGSRSVKVENRRPSRHCDNLGYHRWYRFMGEAGTAMPTEPPPSSHRCGSDAPVWVNGTNPTYEDGVVERQVCARVSGNICRWNWKIHVKACPGGYLIYKLPPIKLKRCRSTYCGLGNNVTVKDVVTIISKKDGDASEGFYKEGNVSNDTPLQGCSSYEELSEAWRSAHVWTYPGHDQHFKCDGRHTAVNGSWYRFTGAAGDMMVTERPLTTNRCGTHAPVWMRGTHPTLDEGVVRRTVCAFYSDRRCLWRWKIHVRACPGGYYVYKLPPPPKCNTAYCTNGTELLV
ncbi:PREDICTED: uncharacterized protein LOC109481125 [Branchiostoma belcheri]|uniref:Uncharacterized protein LOC109481125 n=1 Tax=Branchiostoma belcheri TaxID=7741 RepID=A0A6P5ABL2_BRABE|nr:PREDICTED: uncharacterized protein LOC109481125 [Branchiostoma belcheri]